MGWKESRSSRYDIRAEGALPHSLGGSSFSDEGERGGGGGGGEVQDKKGTITL